MPGRDHDRAAWGPPLDGRARALHGGDSRGSSGHKVQPVATVLAVDVGTSSARAQVFDEAGGPGGKLAQERYTRERDPARLVEIARRAIEEPASPASVIRSSPSTRPVAR